MLPAVEQAEKRRTGIAIRLSLSRLGHRHRYLITRDLELPCLVVHARAKSRLRDGRRNGASRRASRICLQQKQLKARRALRCSRHALWKFVSPRIRRGSRVVLTPSTVSGEAPQEPVVSKKSGAYICRLHAPIALTPCQASFTRSGSSSSISASTPPSPAPAKRSPATTSSRSTRRVSSGRVLPPSPPSPPCSQPSRTNGTRLR